MNRNMQFLCKIRIWNLPRLFNKFLFHAIVRSDFPLSVILLSLSKWYYYRYLFLFKTAWALVFLVMPSSFIAHLACITSGFFRLFNAQNAITIKWTVNCRTIFSMARDLVGQPETVTSLDLAADRDQWSKITRIIAHKMNRRINSGKGFISSSDVPWSEWSRIAYPDPYHPKGTHPFLEYLTFAWLFHSNFLPDMTELC